MENEKIEKILKELKEDAEEQIEAVQDPKYKHEPQEATAAYWFGLGIKYAIKKIEGEERFYAELSKERMKQIKKETKNKRLRA